MSLNLLTKNNEENLRKSIYFVLNKLQESMASRRGKEMKNKKKCKSKIQAKMKESMAEIPKQAKKL